MSCFCAKHGLYFSLSYLWRDLVSWDKYYSVKQAGNYQAPGEKKKKKRKTIVTNKGRGLSPCAK